MPDGASLDRWIEGFPPVRAEPPPGTFELGLCMAGAVSAGAYTAGVLDLLIEALDAFEAERMRRRGSGEATLHAVRLRVLGGASAGGMCAALGAMFLDAAFDPVAPGADEAVRRANPLYDAWVRRIDIRALLGTRDLGGGTLRSVLDCTVLDEIVEELVDRRATTAHRPRPWLAERLEVLLTLANLRGVPYALRFGGPGFSHFMWHHADHVRFAVPRAGTAPGTARPDEILLDRFRPRGDPLRELFKAATLGTGAFPLALRPRTVRRPREDYEFRALLHPRSALAEASRRTEPLEPPPPWAGECRPDWETEAGREYAMLCVDGGAMDNEPLELVRRALAGWNGTNPRSGDLANRATILIDPFPNKDDPGPADEVGLAGTVLPLFDALVRNARFKAEDLALAASPDTYSRFLIAPSRGGSWSAPGAIASGYLGGFMGFFAEPYRHHDFMLGRRNARSFLRRHLVLPRTNPLFGRKQDPPLWSDADIERWGVARVPGGPRDHLPVVPLCGRLWADDAAAEDRIEPLPEWPRGAFAARSTTPMIRARAEAAARILYDRSVRPGVADKVGRAIDDVIERQSWAVRQVLTAARRLLERRLLALLDRELPLLPPRLVAEKAEAAIARAVAELDAAR